MESNAWDDVGELEKLAYEVYVETVGALSAGHDPEEQARVRKAVSAGTWIERKALGLALADYLARVPVRTPLEFHAALPVA